MASTKDTGTVTRIFGYHIADNGVTTDTEFTIDSGQSFGQSFQTGSSVNDKTIKYVKIKASKVGTPTADLIIKIVNGNPGSSVLGTLTITPAELATYSSYTIIEKALDTPLQVSASSTYGIEISTASGGWYVIAGVSTGSYAGGSVWANTGSGWVNDFPTADLYFVIRSGAVWFTSDSGYGHILITDKDVSGGYDRIKCNITDPYNGTSEHIGVWISEQSGSNYVEYTEPGDSVDKFRFYNMGIVDSGDTSLLNIKQTWVKWYYVSTSGNDGNDGNTQATAWRTIGKGFANVMAGENLRILGGTYNESNLTFTYSGTSSAPINIECDPITILHGIMSTRGIDIYGKNYININGMDIENCQQGIRLIGNAGCNIYSIITNSNYPNGIDINIADGSSTNLIEKCVLMGDLFLQRSASSNTIRLNKIKRIVVDNNPGSGNVICWNRIKNKYVTSSAPTWWAVTSGGKTVGNYWYGEEANDTDNDCYGFVNLNGVDVYNQIVALGVAYVNCKDSDNNSIASGQSKMQVNVGGTDRNVSISGDSGYSPYNSDRDVYVHTTSDIQVLCILDPKTTDYTKFIVEGSAKITCKKNEW